MTERNHRRVIILLQRLLVQAKKIIRRRDSLLRGLPADEVIVRPRFERWILSFLWNKQTSSALLGLQIPRIERDDPNATHAGCGSDPSGSCMDPERRTNPHDVPEFFHRISGMALSEPQLVISGHKKNIGKSRANRLQRPLQSLHVVADVTGND